jgi:hypothetical protein
MSTASLSAAQQAFSHHLPAVDNAVRWLFRHRRRHRRQDYEEILAQARAAAWSAWVGLLRKGKDPVQVGVHAIANHAARYVRNGRKVGNRSGGQGSMDVYHPRAQRSCDFKVVNLDNLDEAVGGVPRGVWRNCCTPAALACFRVDYADWLTSLGTRRRRIAELLAAGYGTGEVAREVGISAAAVSQTRTWLRRHWASYQGEARSVSN